MFDDEDFGPRTLADPGRLQQDVLQELFERMNGTVRIADPNNGFNFLLEANSAITASQVRLMEDNFDKLYPSRVNTSDGLFRHMSDFDYLGITASPAPLNVRLVFDANFLIDNAISFNEDYNQVLIPENTQFQIGNRIYSLFFPISIRINKRTSNIIVTHDLSQDNPLKAFESNVVETQRTQANGLDLILLTIPTYQFEQRVIEETLVPGTGFRKSYEYADQLYAVRVFTFIDNAWKELNYTLSEDVYDRTQATARIKMFPEQQIVEVSIPYIYFTKGLIGQKLRINILTSEGELNAIISDQEAEATNVLIDFDTAPEHTQILANIPTIQALPLELRVSGGRSGLSFDEVRRRVITGSLQQKVPVTFIDLQNHVNDRGYDLTRSLDNVTDRMYFAHRRLEGGVNKDVPTLVGRIRLDLSELDDVSTIQTFTDDVTLILPNTIFEYDERSNICKPLKDADVQTLQNMDTRQFVQQLNDATFLRSPVHIGVYTSGQFPEARSFNLEPTESPILIFDKENVNSSAQMTLEGAAMRHLDQGTGGYRLRLGVKKTPTLQNAEEADLFILLVAKDRSGRNVYKRAVRNADVDTPDLDMYDVIFNTDYHITNDGYFRTEMNLTEEVTVLSEFFLRQSFSVRFLTTTDVIPNVENDPDILKELPEDFRTLFGLVKQTLTITFGRQMNNIFHPTDAVWTQQQFKRHQTSEFFTYQRDVYKTDENGALVFEVTDEGTLSFEKIATEGDNMLDSQGYPIIQFAKGDLKRDVEGNPIPVEDGRSLIYYVDAMMIDARMYASDAPQDNDYIETLPRRLQEYNDDMSDIQKTLIEETRLFFTPIRTLGRTTFGLGGGEVKTASLGLSFAITYYVSSRVMGDESVQDILRQQTVDVIRDEVKQKTISMTNIAKTLLTTFQDQVISVDIGGINDTDTDQTFFVQNTDAIPMVRLILQEREDSSLAIVPDVDVFFVLDSRTLLQ